MENHWRKFCVIPVACGLTLTTAGCTADDSRSIAVQVLHQHLYCDEAEAGMRLIDAQTLQTMRGGKELRQTLETSPQPSVDVRGHLLLISLGPKSSGGYNIGLTDNAANIREGTLYLPLEVEEPQPDSLQTMQITNPCLVIAIEPGPYEVISATALPGKQVKLPQS